MIAIGTKEIMIFAKVVFNKQFHKNNICCQLSTNQSSDFSLNVTQTNQIL